MRKLTLANLRANPVRFIATMLAIVIGTGFLAGTLVLSDSLSTALRSSASVALEGVDAAVQPSLQGQGRGGSSRTDPLTDAGIPATVLTSVQGTQGVAGAAGNASANLNVLDADGSALLKEANGSAWIPVESLNPYRIVAGAAPTESGQITVDQDTAKRKHWSVGDTLQLATTSGQQSAEIVGLTRYGHQSASGSNGDIVVNPDDAFAFLTSGRPVYDSIYIEAEPGVSPAEVTASVQQALGDQYTVESGDDLRADAAGSAAGIADAIGTGLQIFAYIALFVGCFIIYNTFTIVVAQRVREFALLRAIGASGKQVRRAVLLEALVVGVLASAIGMLVGIGLFLALKELVPQFQVLTGSGDVSLRVTSGAVIQVMAVGVIVTVVSAFIPAFRAARIKPIAALRTASVDRSGTNRFRASAGLFFLVLGVVVLLIGTTVSQALAIGAGALLSFLGVLIGGPVLARGFASGLGIVMNRLGMPSRLAVANAKRNPARTATTANALVIGVFLVVFVTAAGGTVRDYSVKTISQFSGADLNVATTSAGISPELQSQIQATPGIQSSTAVYDGVGLVTSAEGQPVAAGDLATMQSVLGIKAVQGDFAAMSDSQIAVSQGFGGRRGGREPQLGDPVEVTFKSGVSKQFTVGAIIRFNLDVPGDVISSDAALAANPGLLPNKVAITVEPGQLNSVKDSLDDLTASYSSIQVQPGNAFAQTIKGVFNFLISSVNALLALAVVIAAFGIVNTLVLSVTERTPEIGLLRSVGMSRRQLRSSIRSEAVIVAADGTVIGIVFGLFVAWAVTQPLFSDGASFSWPIKEMGVVVLLGLAIGVLASFVPAWRASRLDVLDAISSE